jgi:hypothetical protein
MQGLGVAYHSPELASHCPVPVLCTDRIFFVLPSINVDDFVLAYCVSGRHPFH